MEGVDKQPHIHLSKVDPVVLVVGDPGRVEIMAKLADEYSITAYNREYKSARARVGEEWISIVSHGIGCAGASICFEELIKVGAKVLIRCGTCGSLSPSCEQGSMVLITAAVREDGATPLMVPLGYPATADFRVVSRLFSAAKEKGTPVKLGPVLTSDAFYPGVMPSSLELYSKAGCLAVEMECASLFVVTSLRGVYGGALAVVDGNPLKWSQGDYDPSGAHVTATKQKMLELALHAAADIASEFRQFGTWKE